MRSRFKFSLPGFGITMGITLTYLGVLIVFPILVLIWKSLGLGWATYFDIMLRVSVLQAFGVSIGCALAAAVLNGFFGFLVAWVHIRYNYFGKKIMDALIDLPFALPTSVAGIALASAFGPTGVLGQFLAELGIHVAYTRVGVVLALTFVGLPFVIRTVEPVLAKLNYEYEEASFCLGAKRWTTFRRVLLPLLFPSILTGMGLSFARALGEYGSVVFISGNLPGQTQIVPLLIMTKLEQFDYAAAMAISTTMLVVAFVVLLMINGFKAWQYRWVVK